MFDSGWTSSRISGGLYRENGLELTTATAERPNNLSIMSLRTTGNVEASNFSNDRNIRGRYVNGDLGELLIFTTPLSLGEMEKVEGYLAHKWGLNGDLPSVHPYKNGFSESYTYGSPLHTLKDKSGQENDAIQETNASQPEFVKNVLGVNGDLPVLRFDGSDDFLSFEEEVNSIRTVFMVVNRNPGNEGFLLGHPTAYAFHPGVNTVWSSSWTDTAILNGLLRANGNTKDGLVENYPSSEPVILGIRTTGVVRASNLSKDRSNNLYFHGEVAEVLMYNEPLPTSAMRMVEGYLAHKWGTVATLNNNHPYKKFAPLRSTPSAQTKIYWGGTDGGEDPTLWENVIDVGEVYVGLRRLEKGISVLAAPKPNDSGGTYSERKLIDLQFPDDGWRSSWTAWFKKDPELTFNLGGLRQMNKIRIYHQPFERDDELMDVAVWIADEEMNFELLKTIPGEVGTTEQGRFTDIDLEGISTQAI
ncbi:MAG: hypothetical protein EBW42_13660, partial [Rhodobacterales bacterium]|nr:hypothetical protein [Rhodobacterales bacterium]